MANQKLGTAMPNWVAPISEISGHLLWLPGGNDAKGQGNQGGEQQSDQGQRQGDGQACADQLGHRNRIGIAGAKIARKHAGDPEPIAFGQGQIEAQLLTQRGQRVFLCIDAENQFRRVTRQDLHHSEDKERRRDQGQT